MGRFALVVLLLAAGCGGAAAGTLDGGDSGDGGGSGDGGSYPGPGDDLDQAEGCPGVFNPNQLLRYDLEMAPGDWATVLADNSYSVFVPAQLSCGGAAPITVGVRRKRSGGTNKVGLKIDINQQVPGQRYFDLRKLSFENGVSEGTSSDATEVETYVMEYLAWRLVTLSQMIGGRAALAELYVNGDVIGVYVNVEQVDKRFLDDRLGDDTGWLYKKSGGINDGLKTHETDGLDDPYDDYLCFWDRSSGCPLPADLSTELPLRVDLDQLLTLGAVNAIMANSDAPLFKDNNYYWYDYAGGGRVYLPWDLDTVMNRDIDVLTGGVGGQTDLYTGVLFPTWEDQYRAILQALLADSLTETAIRAELERVAGVASDAFSRDPYVTGSVDGAVSNLESYWTARLDDVAAQLGQ